MSEAIHDDELDTSEATVRALLAEQCPQWADQPLSPLRTSGTDNAMWRVADAVVRLPRRARSAVDIDRELDLLARLPAVVTAPEVRHVGEPTEAFPHRWGVLGWIDGVDAWTARDRLHDDLALDVAALVHALGGLDLDAPERPPGRRGGPLLPLLDSLERWLSDPDYDAPGFVDVAAVRRLADEAREVADEPFSTTFVHGDLIPGNLITVDGRLRAVIDWTSAAIADPAQDLGPAWAVFEGRSRARFREAMGADDAAWLRARTFALEQGVAGTVYYTPKGHPLGEVMARQLRRILEEAA